MPTYNHPIVGRVSFRVNNGLIIHENDWAAKNISSVYIPQLKGVPTYGGKFSGHVTFYTPAQPQLKAAFEELESLSLLHHIIFWDGSYVPRTKRGSSTSPSNHAFGTAFDINAEWNPFRRPVAPLNHKGCVIPLQPTFKKYGFLWGGDWKNTPDGMHEEVKVLLSPAGVDRLRNTQSNPKSEHRLILNDQVVPGAKLIDGHWQAPIKSILTDPRFPNTSPAKWSPTMASVVRTLNSIGYQIDTNHMTDNRAVDGKFYLYAYRNSQK